MAIPKDDDLQKYLLFGFQTHAYVFLSEQKYPQIHSGVIYEALAHD